MNLPGMQAVSLNGVALLAHVSGALFWPQQGLLAVADLHLEKASSLARRGDLLPPYDTAATLERLASVVAALKPSRLLFLGDSFHDPGGAARLDPMDRARLADLASRLELIWIEGNHDLGGLPRDLGSTQAELTLGALTFRHEALAQSGAGEISGHFHPKARLKVSTGRTTARCFIFDRRRLILPAFGALTGGLEVRDPAIAGLFPQGFKLIALGKSTAVLLPEKALG
ncbi:MAG: ligase-associated DNA damage response endonuclease PdeM [Rhodospirillales bacterium]